MRFRHLAIGTAWTCLIGAALIAVVLLLTGCERGYQYSHTPLGIHLHGDNISDELVEDIDASFVEAFNCWDEITPKWFRFVAKPKDVIVFVADVEIAYAQGYYITIDRLEPYWVIRHEMSHAIGYIATGEAVPNYDGRCFL